MFESSISWLINNYIELLGALSGIIYIFLSIRQSIWLWPVGLITSAFYVIIFYKDSLYADMALQIYYVLASIYGWLHWMFGKTKEQKEGRLSISTLKLYQWIFVIIICLCLTALYYPVGKYFNASFPIIDGFVVAGSIVATWMLTRKILEQWLVWIVIDGVSVGLVLAKGRYLTAFLMLVYTVMAIKGYVEWKREMKKVS